MTDTQTFNSYQKFTIFILAFLQFTIILDFMILAPLGAIIMPTLNINAAEFGMVVSVYAFAAGISGIMAASVADRFDRKKFLLFFYAGFIVGTLFCGLAYDYKSLLLARMVTGIFAGVIGSIVGSIVTDLFAYEIRGRVMGIMQTSFAMAQVMGIPLGLFLSNHWGWHIPFMMIVAISALIGVLVIFYLKPLKEHLILGKIHSSIFKTFSSILSNKQYLAGFSATAFLHTGGFMLMPFSSAFSVHNLGISLAFLPIVYLVTGGFSMFAGPLIGKACDQLGKFRVYTFGTIINILMVLIYTNLGITPIPFILLVNILLFLGIFARMIPSSAIISAVPNPEHRGAYMAVSSALQQMAGGCSALIAGHLIITSDSGRIENFPTLGSLYCLIGIGVFIQMYFINKSVNKKMQKEKAEKKEVELQQFDIAS